VRDLYASPADFWDVDESARELARVTGADETRLQRTFAPKHGYVPVKRALSPTEQDAVMQLGLPGLTFEDGHKRYYPGGRSAVHSVGLVDVDNKGVSGLELGLDSRLSEGGDPVQLSLDMRIQYTLAHEIEEGMSEFQPKAAGGVVLNVRTGEVLALVSLPDFESSDRAPTAAAARNRMAQDVYELGSIFKIFSFAEAIEEKTVRLNETFKVSEPLKLGRYQIHDFERLGPTLTAAMVFAQSSNIGTAQIAMRTTSEHQRAFLQRMGLLTSAKAELPESAAPLIPAHWGDVETATISFGHGISVSPLAFAAAAAAVVNGGTLIVPTFLKRDTPQHGKRVISEQTSVTMRGLMRLVVTDGTGTKADVPGYDVGGKTGTAEKPHNGGYSRRALISSFCGVFPIDNPQYLVFVMLDEPKGTRDTAGFATAGYTSAPVAGRVIERIAPLLGVLRDDTLATADGQRESTKQP
jgi:cell division protein FtsI (penicillin-binding protein 3)